MPQYKMNAVVKTEEDVDPWFLQTAVENWLDEVSWRYGRDAPVAEGPDVGFDIGDIRLEKMP